VCVGDVALSIMLVRVLVSSLRLPVCGKQRPNDACGSMTAEPTAEHLQIP